MKPQNTSSAFLKYCLLIEKAKYYINIKKFSQAEEEKLPLANTVSANNEISIAPGKESKLKSFLKNVKRSVPESLMFNSLTEIIYGHAIKIIDAKEKKLRAGMKSNLILFDGVIPERFELPVAINFPDVSIIIPVHNKFDYTFRCIYSIREHSNGINYEVIVADDASTDLTTEIGSRIKNVKVNRNENSLGFLGNCNTAATLATGKYILFLNNDTVVQQNWLSSLIKLMEYDSKIGMTGSKLVYPEGLLQEAGGIIWKDGSGWNYGKNYHPNAPEYNYVKEVDFISGAAIMIRSSLWKEIGGFDKRFTPAYYEDTDLAFEIRKRGYKVKYQPESVVVHFEGISHGTDISSGIKSYQLVNKEKFVDKWANELTKQFENEQDLFLARDRSKNKPTMLFIDHYPPEPDKDAGSKSCFQYLQLFSEMGFNIKFIGDNYIKTEPYTSVLQQMGIEVLYGYHYQQNWKEWSVQHKNDIQYVFLNRPFVSEKYIDFLKTNLNAKIIFFGHDLHYLREERQYKTELNKELLTSAKTWKEMEFDIFSKSDLVLYPSQSEIDEIHNVNSEINAAVIPLNYFEKNSGSDLTIFPDQKNDLLFVGGFNHLPNVDAVIWFCKEIFPLILKANSKIRFIVVGSNITEQIKQLASENIIIKGYVSESELEKLYNDCRMVIAPLRFGAGVKGKIIEGIYYRCAVVTTSIGAEGINNSMGLITIADTVEDFSNAIISLYTNEDRLKQIFADSPIFISNNFSKASAENFVRKYIL